MAALVVPGAPVSVLLDHGLSDKLLEKLAEAGVSTVEQLGSMTPEQLEEISGIGPKMVERIQTAVVNYYGQFEVDLEGRQEAAGSEAAAEPAPETENRDAGEREEEAEALQLESEWLEEPESEEAETGLGETESATIEDSGPVQQGADPDAPERPAEPTESPIGGEDE
jgi:N utilization substance protein A